MLLPEINTWVQWGKIFTDTKIWTPIIKEICEKEGIQFIDIRSGFPGTNAVFILDNTYVIKIYPKRCHSDYEHELEIQGILQENSNIIIPRILYNGVFMDRVKWPYIIMEYIQGEAIRDVRDKIARQNKIEIYSQLGKMVKEIHDTSFDSMSNMNISDESYKSFINHRIKDCVKENIKKEVLSEKVIDQIPDFINSVDITPQNFTKVLVNGDLTEDHLLLKKCNGRWEIAALIDLADGKIAQREYDWIALWFSLLNSDVEGMKAFMYSYNSSININEEFRNKAMVFTFLHQFGAEIIENELKNEEKSKIESIEQLKDLLWPQALKGDKNA